ncbi:DUF5375 domain-containing protein [Serratia ureilytica]|uniref:DUF5375 domain-containing protein n=1 Tax=Serratia ureilytica TaxID=300181 RepID=A0ABU0VQA8_9GAMM|nr:DUF5375 domain-containing protein [Serratia ureilytica]MCU7062661.1 DUF5375 domain-containing protein [Serratia ureilytica]MDQ1810742.1 DUF5375 domain-containing protein [Serratia ureilytica]MDQ1839770.1 DUF5375 domain-containing protein [Serratia ureilytica]MDQ1863393.1 DUF5375 domain-containing protein [Serratia ureilytica]
MTLDNGSASCIPLEVRTALFRRAVAEAYLAACAAQGMTLPHTLDSLQMLIASDIEALFVKLHGVDEGMAIACSLLGDMVAPDILLAAPQLTSQGCNIMAELCGVAVTSSHPAPTLH